MKTLRNSIWVLSVLLLIACGKEQKQGKIPTIDVTKSYPKKEIVLQDIANVEYIPLETRDDVLIGGGRIIPVGKDKLLTYSLGSGDVFIFDINGKFINKFNHKGQSGQEYIFMVKILVDTKKDEIFIVDAYKNNTIQVYTMQGKYKRTLKIEELKLSSNITLLGDDKIMCYENPNVSNFFKKEKKEEKPPRVIILEKEMGKKTDEVLLSATKGVNPCCAFNTKGGKAFMIQTPEIFVQSPNGIIINEIACDTVFALTKEQKLLPVLARTPKVSPQDEPLKMLGIEALSKEAYYLEVILKKYDPTTRKGFDKTVYQVERTTNQIFEYTLKNTDAPTLQKLAKLSKYTLVPAIDLIEALEEGKLSGKLKEIAENLKEDDNPVLMRVTLR